MLGFHWVRLFVRQLLSVGLGRGRLRAPNHWPRNFFENPPCDADFPLEVYENFDDGQPWFDFSSSFSVV